MARKKTPKTAVDRVSERRLFDPEKTAFLDRALSVEKRITALELALPNSEEATNKELNTLKDELLDIEKEWNDRKWNPSYKAAMRRYSRWARRNPSEAAQGAVSASVEAITTRTIEGLTDLQSQIEKFLDKGNVTKAAQELVARGLSSSDLVGGPNQTRAIRTFFDSRPDLAAYILALGPEDKRRILHELEGTVEGIIETLESSRASYEQMEKEVVMGSVETKVRALAGKAADHPGYTLVGLIAGIGVLAVANHYKDKLPAVISGPLGFLTQAGMVGGVGAGLVVAANWIHRNLSEDESGFLDNISLRSVMLDKEQYDMDHASSKWKQILSDKVTDRDRESTEALVAFGESRATDVAVAFRHALSSPAKDRRIDTGMFSGKARTISGRDAYDALAYVMEICANQAGVSVTEKPRQRLLKGLNEFQRRFDNSYTLNSAIAALVASADFPRSPEELVASGELSFSRTLGRPASTPAEIEKAKEIMVFFNKIVGLDMPVEARAVIGGKSIIAIKGYLFEYQAVDNMHEFVDAATGKKISIPIDGENTVTLAKGLESYIDTKMNERVRKAFGDTSLNVVFDKETTDMWIFAPPYNMAGSQDIGKGRTNKEIPLKIFCDNETLSRRTNSDIKLYCDKLLNNNEYPEAFATLEEAKEAYEMRVALPEIIQTDLAYYIGDMGLIVTDKLDATNNTVILNSKNPAAPAGPIAGGTVLEIKYGTSLETIGHVVYRGGKLAEFYLPDNTEIEDRHRELARQKATHWKTKMLKSGSGRRLSAAFEKHWNGAWWENLTTIPVGRAIESVSRYWLEDDHLGRGITHGRETWHDALIESMKMAEYEYYFEQQVYSILEENPSDLTARLQKLDANMTKTVGEEFDRVSQYIEDELEGTEGTAERGMELERVLNESLNMIDRIGYQNTDYANFTYELESMMSSPGFDYVGADGWRSGRSIRESARLSAYTIAWPIPGLAPGDVNADHKDFLAKLPGQFKVVLQVAQKAEEGNKDWIIFEDNMIAHIDFAAAFEDLGFKSFKKVSADKGNTAAYEAAVLAAERTTATAPAPTISSSAGGGGTLSATERIELRDDVAEELRGVYKPIDGIERSATSWYKDDYDAVYEEFVNQKVKAYAADTAGLTKRSDFDAVKEKHLGYAENARREFLHWTSGATNQETSIDGARALMLETMAPGDPSWNLQSELVAGLFIGEYEYDQFVICENAMVLMDIMNFWNAKIAPGTINAGPGGYTAENYRNYFLYYALAVADTAKDADGTLTWEKWKKVRTHMNSIKPYSTWATVAGHEARPTPPGLDLSTIMSQVETERKEQVTAEFREWYKKELEITEYFVFNRDWKRAYEASVEKRIMDMRTSSVYASSSAFEQGLENFKVVIGAERTIYNEIKLRGIDPNDLGPGGAQQFLDDVIYASFDTAFGTSPLDVDLANLSTYITALETNFDTITQSIDIAEYDKKFKKYLRQKRISMVDLQNLPTNALDAMMWQSVFADSAQARYAGMKSSTTPANMATDYAELIEFFDAETVIWTKYINAGVGVDAGWTSFGVELDKVINKLDASFDTYYTGAMTGSRDANAYRQNLIDTMPNIH